MQNGIINLEQIQFPAPFLAVLLPTVIAFIVPYLLGSLNTAVLVSRALYGEDIRRQGSGNAGLTNMMRVYGKKAALFVLFGDVLKMVLSLLFVGFLLGFRYGPCAFSLNPFTYLAGVACILGHIFPVYFKFKGGKGVLCTAAMVLVLSPIVFAVEILIFVLLVAVTRYVSLASVSVGLLYPLVLNRTMALCGYTPIDGMIMLVSVLVAALIFYCHRTNIVRLKERRESRFYFSKAKREADKERLRRIEQEMGKKR